MTLNQDKIISLVLASLSSSELKASIVYLDEQILPAGNELNIDWHSVRVPWSARLAFVDLQPEMNWGHECRYVLVNVENGELQVIAAHFPPSITGLNAALRVVWRGEYTPDWAVAA